MDVNQDGLNKENKIWDLLIELRKELVESQKIRSQVLGFKITFVAAVIGLIAKGHSIDNALFVIPAFSAICFDFLIYSYSFSIKRIGSYIRSYLEPALKIHGHMPSDLRLWQEFLTDPKTRQRLALWGNIGFTFLTLVVALVALFVPFRPLLSTSLIVGLIVFFTLDIKAYLSPKKLGKQWVDGNKLGE